MEIKLPTGEKPGEDWRKERVPADFILINGHPTLKQLEMKYIEYTLEKHHGHREKTCAALGISRSTLCRKMHQLKR